MASETDFPARGRVTGTKDGRVIFKPSNTTYELHLDVPGGQYDGPLDTPIDCHIRLNARKIYTVPSGGNFVTPIFGPPRIVQGRVRFISERQIVVHAGCSFIVTLPAEGSAIDLNNGAVSEGVMVNVVSLPGARFELINQPAMA